MNGFILLKVSLSLRYRGVDRQRFEPQIIEDELSADADAASPDIWTMYPQGWRRDAYQLFSANQISDSGGGMLLNSAETAQAVLRLLPPTIGQQYEIIECDFLSVPSVDMETATPSDAFLGYDLAYPGGDYYSAIRNGLHVNPHPELVSKYASHLNEYGLFVHPQHFSMFMSDFRNLVPSEAEANFIVYKLSEA